jgi:type II secretory pathway component HofQ
MPAPARLLPLLALLLATGASAGEPRTEIIYSTRADELQPVLAPLAEPDGQVSVYRDQLVIRATPEKMAQIRALLEKLDRPLKNLRISVRRQQEAHSSSSGITGRGRVAVRDGKAGGRIDLQAGQQQDSTQGETRYSLMAREGDTVFISTGTDIPVLSVARSGKDRIVAGQVYVPVHSGVEVTPRLQPDGRAVLDISVQQAEVGRAGIQREQTQTVLAVRLGEWTPLSRIEHSASGQQSGPAGRRQWQSHSSVPLEILLEELP